MWELKAQCLALKREYPVCTRWQGFFILIGDLLRAHNSKLSTAHLCLVTMKNLMSRESIFISRKMDPKCHFFKQQQLSESSTTVFASSRESLLQHSVPHPMSCIFKSIMHIKVICRQSHAACYSALTVLSYPAKMQISDPDELLHWVLWEEQAGKLGTTTPCSRSYRTCPIKCNCLLDIFFRSGSCVRSLAQLIVSVKGSR